MKSGPSAGRKQRRGRAVRPPGRGRRGTRRPPRRGRIRMVPGEGARKARRGGDHVVRGPRRTADAVRGAAGPNRYTFRPGVRASTPRGGTAADEARRASGPPRQVRRYAPLHQAADEGLYSPPGRVPAHAPGRSAAGHMARGRRRWGPRAAFRNCRKRDPRRGRMITPAGNTGRGAAYNHRSFCPRLTASFFHAAYTHTSLWIPLPYLKLFFKIHSLKVAGSSRPVFQNAHVMRIPNVHCVDARDRRI